MLTVVNRTARLCPQHLCQVLSRQTGLLHHSMRLSFVKMRTIAHTALLAMTDLMSLNRQNKCRLVIMVGLIQLPHFSFWKMPAQDDIDSKLNQGLRVMQISVKLHPVWTNQAAYACKS